MAEISKGWAFLISDLEGYGGCGEDLDCAICGELLTAENTNNWQGSGMTVTGVKSFERLLAREELICQKCFDELWKEVCLYEAAKQKRVATLSETVPQKVNLDACNHG